MKLESRVRVSCRTCDRDIAQEKDMAAMELSTKDLIEVMVGDPRLNIYARRGSQPVSRVTHTITG